MNDPRPTDIAADLPPQFDPDIYSELHLDLRHLQGAQLRSHWDRHGRREGRRTHGIADRDAFTALIAPDARVLELGPFYHPLVRGDNVRYLDMLDHDELVARAQNIGLPSDDVPEVHFVSRDGTLDLVGDGEFDVVVSSHVIEHQPDLVRHLDEVQRVLAPGGSYFVLAPDIRYCFDRFLPESTLAQVVEAHELKRSRPSLRSRLEHAALRTHNEHRRHWQGDHGVVSGKKERLLTSLCSFEAAPQAYEDVHAWYFTPESFERIMNALHGLELVQLAVARLYPTLHDNNEFWAVFRAPR